MAVPKLIGQPAWFGKIPSESEFFSRRVSVGPDSSIEGWMRDGMRHLAVVDPDDWRERYLVTPLWHFAMTGDVWSREPIIGCLGPSADRFGRSFPLIVLQCFEDRGDALGALLPPQCDWFVDVDRLVRECIGQALSSDDFDQRLIKISETIDIPGTDSTTGILRDLGIAESGNEKRRVHFPWPDLKDIFSSRRQRSFWWAETAPTRPARQIVHSGRPDTELFGLLFGSS